MSSQVVGGFVHVRGVPVHDRGDDQVQGHHPLLLCATRPVADAALGTATGIWGGKAFSYTFSNIEHVSGGPSLDIFIDSGGDDTFEGRGNTDLFIMTEGGNDTIVDFSDYDDDVLWLNGDLANEFGLTKLDVIAAATQDGDDVLIDLSTYGMGTVRLRNFNIDSLGEGDLQDLRTLCW